MAEQLALIDEPEDAGFDADTAQMPLVAKGVSGPRGGRPRGALNKSTAEWRRFILSRYRSPLVALVETYSRSAEDLARELRMFRYREDGSVVRDADGREALREGALEDALRLQMQAASGALPYLHSKMPLAVDVKNESGVTVVIGEIEGLRAGDDGMLIIEHDAQENQSLSIEHREQSDDE